MLKNPQHAHNAFVYGELYAVLALMRSTMEAVLRDSYERISSARPRLPPGASEASLHRLRKLANTVLHLDGKKDMGLSELNEITLEKEIVSLFAVLRALIEGWSFSMRLR